MSKIFNSVLLKYISVFKKESDELLREMEVYARENNIPILAWQSAEFIEQIIRMLDPKRVLELGTAIAYTTIRIARELKGKSQIHTIEKSTNNISTAKRFVEKSRLGMKIKLLEGDALNIMPQLKKKYDLTMSCLS